MRAMSRANDRTEARAKARETSEKIRAARFGQIRRLVKFRCGPELPEDDAGEEYLLELLLLASMAPNEPELKMKHICETMAPWLPADDRFKVFEVIARMQPRHRRLTPRQLGDRLNLTNAERERHKIWAILPADMTDAQLKEHNKAKNRDRMREKRRQNGSKPQANSINSTKPWLLENPPISESTYYRRKRKQLIDDDQSRA
jgi:hypothetical protein